MTDTYDIDDDLKSLLELTLSLAQNTVDIQYNEDTQADLQEVLELVAQSFRIEYSIMKESVTENPDGSVTIKLESDNVKPKPKLTLVSSNDSDEE